jgi:hypothetical protein
MNGELEIGVPAIESRGEGFAHDRGKDKTKHEWLTPPDLLALLVILIWTPVLFLLHADPGRRRAPTSMRTMMD